MLSSRSGRAGSALCRSGAWARSRRGMASQDDPRGASGGGGDPDDVAQRFYGFDEDTSAVAVPSELAILPLRGVVIFPSAIVPLLISRGSSLKLVEDCRKGDNLLGLATQKNPDDENPAAPALFARGCAGRILKMLKYPDGSGRILVQGVKRIEIRDYVQYEPYFRARVAHLQDAVVPSKDLDAF